MRKVFNKALRLPKKVVDRTPMVLLILIGCAVLLTLMDRKEGHKGRARWKLNRKLSRMKRVDRSTKKYIDEHGRAIRGLDKRYATLEHSHDSAEPVEAEEPEPETFINGMF